MPNITLAIDQDLLKSARAYARRNGTTLNALVRQQLTNIIDADRQQEEARKGLLELIAHSTGRMGKGFKFNRDEMYETKMLRRYKRPSLRRRRSS